ncbi:hypothetical protein NKJ84_28165 [Mesorhizobium sp. M0048]|uniref:hypothetical protein n=1 Tax=Mesorhizobium sp. M0048 TaxID=2956860 RepID=UPI0033394FD5
MVRLRLVREQINAIEQERLQKWAPHTMIRLISRVISVGELVIQEKKDAFLDRVRRYEIVDLGGVSLNARGFRHARGRRPRA